MKRKPQKILILGLGLMGGSLAAALKRKDPKAQVTAVSRNQQALSYAKKKGWIDQGALTLQPSFCDADIAVVCTPVDTEPAQILKLDRAAPKAILVTDVGSVKGSLQDWVSRQKFKNVQFVSAHPMVGSHDQGIKAARENLYTKGLVFLIRSARQSAQNFSRVKSFWQSLGMRAVAISAKEHDVVVGEISHLPHAAAVCLMNAIKPENLSHAASGFRDTTRVAAGHPSIWAPIFLENSQVISRTLETFEKEIRSFRKAIRSKNSKTVQKKLILASQKRQEI